MEGIFFGTHESLNRGWELNLRKFFWKSETIALPKAS